MKFLNPTSLKGLVVVLVVVSCLPMVKGAAAEPAFLYKVGIIKKHCSSICCNEQVTISQNKIIICHPADIPYSESYYMVIAVSWQLWPVSQNL